MDNCCLCTQNVNVSDLISFTYKNNTFVKNRAGIYRFIDVPRLDVGKLICDQCVNIHPHEPVYYEFCLCCHRGRFSYNTLIFNLKEEESWGRHGAVALHNEEEGIATSESSLPCCSPDYDDKRFMITDPIIKEHSIKYVNVSQLYSELKWKKHVLKCELLDREEEEPPSKKQRGANLSQQEIESLIVSIKQELSKMEEISKYDLICCDCMPKLLQEQKLVCISTNHSKCKQCLLLAQSINICPQCYGKDSHGHESCNRVWNQLEDKNMIICDFCKQVPNKKF